MQNVITITAPKIKTYYRDGGKHGAFEDTCSAPHFMDIRTLMHFTWVKSHTPHPPSSTFWRQICAQGTNTALSIIRPAQLTAKSFPNFPILSDAVLLDYLVMGMRDELQAQGNSIPLSLEELYWQLEVRCWPWLLYPVFFSPASNHNRNLKQNCPKLS